MLKIKERDPGSASKDVDFFNVARIINNLNFKLSRSLDGEIESITNENVAIRDETVASVQELKALKVRIRDRAATLRRCKLKYEVLKYFEAILSYRPDGKTIDSVLDYINDIDVKTEGQLVKQLDNLKSLKTKIVMHHKTINRRIQ